MKDCLSCFNGKADIFSSVYVQLLQVLLSADHPEMSPNLTTDTNTNYSAH